MWWFKITHTHYRCRGYVCLIHCRPPPPPGPFARVARDKVKAWSPEAIKVGRTRTNSPTP